MPERTCLGCRKVLPQDELLRYVLTPEGIVFPDYRRKLPGRGGYTCLKTACIEDAVRYKRFDRTFKRKCLPVDPLDIQRIVASQMRERIQALLGMGRKSSSTVTGSNMVLDMLDSEDLPAIIFLAEDISEGIETRILSKAKKRSVPVFRFLAKETLGHVVGKGERSVVGLKKSAIAETIKAEMHNYMDFLGEN